MPLPANRYGITTSKNTNFCLVGTSDAVLGNKYARYKTGTVSYSNEFNMGLKRNTYI